MNGAALRVTSGPLAGEVFPLAERQVVIGRSATCEICGSGYEELSRRHARLAWIGCALVIEDLESRNGVRVDGRPVHTARLEDGSRLELGDFRAELTLPAAAEPALEAETPAPRPPASPAQPAPAAKPAANPWFFGKVLAPVVVLGCLVAPARAAWHAAWGAAPKTPEKSASRDLFVKPAGKPETRPGLPDHAPGGFVPPSPAPAPTDPAADRTEAVRAATVVVARRDASGDYHVTGAGSLADGSSVVTTRTAVCEPGSDRPADVMLVFFRGTSREQQVAVPRAKVYAAPLHHSPSDQLIDVAVVAVSDPPAEPLGSGAFPLDAGQSLFVGGLVRGASGQSEAAVTRHPLHKVDEVSGTPFLLFVEGADATPGAPVVDDRGGLVGIVLSDFHARDGGFNGALCLAMPGIRRLIGQHGSGGQR